jgi:hypothetical protein
MENDEQSKARRDEFLIQWYGVLWSNVNRSMEGIWKVLAPIAVVGTIMAAVQQGYLPLALGSALTFVILLWALNMTIDLNQWHRRNLIFLTAVEREFMLEEDYGRLIPAKYRTRGSGWIRFYTINALIFTVLLILAAGYAALYKTDVRGACYHWTILAAGVVLTGVNVWDTEKRAREYASELSEEATRRMTPLEAAQDDAKPTRAD